MAFISDQTKADIQELFDMGWTKYQLQQKMESELIGIRKLFHYGVLSESGAAALTKTCEEILAALKEGSA